MPPRTLASLAQSLSVATDVESAMRALGESLLELDRFAQLAWVRFDARRSLMRDRMLVTPRGVEMATLDTTLDHLPQKERISITAGGQFVDFGESSDEYGRIFDLPRPEEGGILNVRGMRFDGALSSLLVLYEPRKIFGTRTAERFAPAAALFDLAHARFLEFEARQEAVATLEDFTQRLHVEYEKKLAALEQKLLAATGEFAVGASPARVVELERELAHAVEVARRTQKRLDAVEGTVSSAVEQLEKAHIELHRRSEQLRQRTRTLYLIDRVLTLDNNTDDPRQLADGLLALVGDDMHSQRCSLLLRAPEEGMLYIAAAKGIAPNITEGARIRVGHGVSGKVAANREPILVQDVAETRDHPLLKDEYFTSGSFISFPLVYHDELIGVVNLTNRLMQGVFVDEDVERVRLLSLVIALVASNARLPERLIETLNVG
ncbi:MAG TPA: GAF domain-containing protein [Gemmatimonadaceae bacterium]|nr:GAF domain-containing protein [Gemmatimonadaceae bacterium]